jgi:hypothetical protein
VRDAIFESAQKYSEWMFIHTPPTAAAAAKPAAGAAATGAAGAKPTDPIQSPGAAAPNPPGGPMQGAKPPATGLEGTKH